MLQQDCHKPCRKKRLIDGRFQRCVPFPLYGIRATLFWPVIVLLCSLSLRLCLLETLVLSCCVPFLPSLAPP